MRALLFSWPLTGGNPGTMRNGNMQTQAYLRTPEAAKYLGISTSTLERGRVNGTGPKFRQMGARIIAYAVQDLDEWANQQVLSSTSERSVA